MKNDRPDEDPNLQAAAREALAEAEAKINALPEGERENVWAALIAHFWVRCPLERREAILSEMCAQNEHLADGLREHYGEDWKLHVLRPDVVIQ